MKRNLVAVTLSGLVTLALGSGPAGAAPPGDSRPTIQWANSWQEAVEEATARNVPIFVSFHKDG